MVNEREPSQLPASSQNLERPRPTPPNIPTFGGLSIPRSQLPFIIPKRRPEPTQTSGAASTSKFGSGNAQPHTVQNTAPQSYRPSHDPDVVEIPRPTNQTTFHTTRPAPPPSFTAFGTGGSSFTAVNRGNKPHNLIDLTTHRSMFSYDQIVNGASLARTENHDYVDPAKAAESIKALLQGAFDDDEDLPRTRLRKKKAKDKANLLIQNLNDMKIGKEDAKTASSDAKEGKTESGGQHQEKDEDGDEEDDEGLDSDDDGTVEGLEVQLLPHQVIGLAWMRNKEVGQRGGGTLPKGGILADDMGLGKTLQSISLMLSNPFPTQEAESHDSPKPKQPLPGVERSTLVVAPLALIKQWESEIENRVSSSHKLHVCIHHGPQRTKRYQDLRRYDVVITTYQVLVSEHKDTTSGDGSIRAGCFGIHWYRVILDEAHTIKNRNAKATKACYALRAEYRWCLTGTPMQNNLDELQSLIQFLRIKPYNDIRIWKEQITDPMKRGRGDMAMKRLQVYLKAFMKRRTKDILKKEGALNPGGKPSSGDVEHKSEFRITERKIVEVVAKFSPDEQKFYDSVASRADRSLKKMMQGQKLNYASALTLLLRMRQVCNHPGLVAGKLNKDSEALSVSATNVNQTVNATDDEMDSLARMLGSLEVQIKNCEICQGDLTKEEVAHRAIRCADCQGDIAWITKPSRLGKTGNGKPKKSHNLTDAASRKIKHRPQILDSDDEQDSLENSTNSPSDGEGPNSAISIDDSDGESADLGGEDLAELKSSTKIDHLLKILGKEAVHHKFIVFSQFTSMLDLIEPFLERRKFKYTRYDGSMKNDLREASLNRLRNDPRTRVLLCSLKCGSLGLNLTAASRVVILEPFWNPFVEEQAIDRVHRLNQTVDVIVYKITVSGTVEERILELQEKKRELANAAIEGKDAGKLSMKDIMRLFQRDAENVTVALGANVGPVPGPGPHEGPYGSYPFGGS